MRWGLIALWIVTSLFIAHFHEPWRDEAQAWLVAKSADSFYQLLYRSALEATGPLYYLLLWPWARHYPSVFPGIIFWISWLGSLSAVALLLLSRRLPLWMSAMAAFGYLFGYEYAVIARLYGWGCFLLLGGILADHGDRAGLRNLLLSLSCLVQLNFVFAIGAWCAFRILRERTRPEMLRRALSYAPVVAAVTLALLHLQMAPRESAFSAFKEWSFTPKAGRIGSTLITPFVQSRGKIGWGGIVFFPVVLLPLERRARFALLVGLIPFLALFLFRYYGVALSRHGGPLFLTWFALCAWAPAEGKWAARALALVLSLSLLTGIEARIREVLLPYSDAQPVADMIGKIARSQNKKPKIFIHEDLVGFVIAARLGTPLWTGTDFVRVDYPAFIAERSKRMARQRFQRPWKEYRQHCFEDEACFLVARPFHPPVPKAYGSEFKLIFSSGGTISDESLVVYEVIADPRVNPAVIPARIKM